MVIINSISINRERNSIKNYWLRIVKNWDLYIVFFPVLLYFIIFHYLPLYGVQIAFKDFIPSKGIFGSPWVGIKHFKRFFNSYEFWILIKNTLGISFYQLAVGFPVPVILALMLNEVHHTRFKKFVQNVTYAPHFISVVVLVGMVVTFLSPSSGIINFIIKALGGEPINFMAKAEYFKTIFVLSGVWKNTGWGSIIYIAALTNIDPQIVESAIIDGASKLKRIWYINIPCILPTMVILLIMDLGKVMNVSFEKVFLMQNSLNMEASDVISTYVYRNGLLGAQYSFSAAVGLFNNIINFILLVTVNAISRRISEISLW